MTASAASDAGLRLRHVLERSGPLAIAVSGGVDSMTLAYLAHRCGDVEVVHALSPAVPPEATALVQRYADMEGWRLTLTRAREFEDPDYLANPVNRCFFCKSNLYDRIRELTTRRIASGANLDDLADYRPGLLAARERDVVHPLVEAGIDKATVRLLARSHGLADFAELPAQPCLSSRVETGIRIDAGDLDFVARVEAAAREKAGAGITVRCRITRSGVVLELADVENRITAEAACAAARSLTTESGRTWLGARDYRRGSAFVHGIRPEQ